MKEKDISIVEKKKRFNQLTAGDIIVTTFWGVKEVCKVYSTSYNDGIVIIRLESIVHKTDVKKDYCTAFISNDLGKKFPFTFLYQSKWYNNTIKENI